MVSLFKFALLIWVYFLPGMAAACSIAGPQKFVPSLTALKKTPRNIAETEYSSSVERRSIPAPQVKVTELKRGNGDFGSLCAHLGRISFEVSLPNGSDYSVDELGIYIRIKRTNLPISIFPNTPMVGELIDKKSVIGFAWVDEYYAEPISLKLEAFMVTNNLNVGPSTIIAVNAEAD